MWYIWLIAAGVFFIAEIITVGFMIFWLGVAALIVTILSLFVSNIFVQMAVFLILSTLLLLFTRPFVDKFANNKETVLTTNVYSIVGKEAIVVKTFDSSSKIGQIKVGSEKWTARSANDEIYSEGDTVRIDSIDGVKAIVSKL
ncbi:MAG: NfeD family protein [Clostridia bacterium]|nr:NfeD family protein [Clostridia bacterium]